MTKEEIVKYVLSSPENTNPNVLEGMLDELNNNDLTFANITVNSLGKSVRGAVKSLSENSTSGLISQAGTHQIILYKGKATLYCYNDGKFKDTDGAIELTSGDYGAIVTGDCSFSTY